MKIVFLDAKTIGDYIDLSGFDALGEVTRYDFTTPEEAPERVKDADVLIINKVPVNEQTIHTAAHLKLVCVTATGTNNLDKDYLASRGIAWRNVAGYSTENFAREMVIFLSSRGWRITSSTLRLNSGISSRNKMPLCAKLISPG